MRTPLVYTALVAVAVMAFAGCATPKATFEMGLYAGQSQAQINNVASSMDARTEFWQRRALEMERAEAARIAATDMALARSLRNPALAAEQGYLAGVAQYAHLAELDRIDATERAARQQDRAAMSILAGTPVDVANMTAKGDKARADFQRSTAQMGMAEGTKIVGMYAEREARIAAEREAKRVAAEMERQRKADAEALAEREHHVTERERALEAVTND